MALYEIIGGMVILALVLTGFHTFLSVMERKTSNRGKK